MHDGRDKRKVLGFDPVEAFNLVLERLDRIIEALEKIAKALEK